MNRAALPGITPRMLTRQLRELGAAGLVVRTGQHQVPPKVECSASEVGESPRTLADRLERWGRDYRERDRDRRGAPRTTSSAAEPRRAGPVPRDELDHHA